MPRTALASADPACPTCLGPVPRTGKLGRPPIYCTPQCRRTAERREFKRLARLGKAVERVVAEHGAVRTRTAR